MNTSNATRKTTTKAGAPHFTLKLNTEDISLIIAALRLYFVTSYPDLISDVPALIDELKTQSENQIT